VAVVWHGERKTLSLVLDMALLRVLAILVMTLVKGVVVLFMAASLVGVSAGLLGL
jgi:hypothetical protein